MSKQNLKQDESRSESPVEAKRSSKLGEVRTKDCGDAHSDIGFTEIKPRSKPAIDGW